MPFEQARDIMEKNYALVIPMKRLDDAIQALGKAFGLQIPAVAHENIGTKKVTAIKGGLEIPSDIGNDPILIANAAVIVSFDDGKDGVVSRFRNS